MSGVGTGDKEGRGYSVWDLIVFQKAYDAALEVHLLARDFPKHEQYELASQLRRSSKSICANITEGRGRQRASAAEFRRFLIIALGSTDETALWLRFSRDLGYLDEDQHKRLAATYSEIARMLNALASKST